MLDLRVVDRHAPGKDSGAETKRTTVYTGIEGRERRRLQYRRPLLTVYCILKQKRGSRRMIAFKESLCI